MTPNDIQKIIDHVVHMATQAAIAGSPVARIHWQQAQSAALDSLGTFAIEPLLPCGAADSGV